MKRESRDSASVEKLPPGAAALVFRALSCMGLVAGVALAFFDLLPAAISLLSSVACAHFEAALRTEKHLSDMHQTLSIVTSLARQVEEKAGGLLITHSPHHCGIDRYHMASAGCQRREPEDEGPTTGPGGESGLFDVRASG